MIKGITQKEDDIIRKILNIYPYKFYYYGSRVKGNYTKSSDLDILLKNSNAVEPEILNELNRKFNESIIPYRVNIAEFVNMDKYFYKLIEKDLVEI